MENFTKEHKMKKLYTFVFLLFFSFALLFLSFNKLTNFENENMLLNKFYQNCEKTIVEIKEIDGEINFKESQLSIFPETTNIFCIGKVSSFNSKSGFTDIEIYSSFVFYKFLIILINLSFVSILIVTKIKRDSWLLILYLFYFSISIFLESLLNFSGFSDLSKSFIYNKFSFRYLFCTFFLIQKKVTELFLIYSIMA